MKRLAIISAILAAFALSACTVTVPLPVDPCDFIPPSVPHPFCP